MTNRNPFSKKPTKMERSRNPFFKGCRHKMAVVCEGILLIHKGSSWIINGKSLCDI